MGEKFAEYEPRDPFIFADEAKFPNGQLIHDKAMEISQIFWTESKKYNHFIYLHICNTMLHIGNTICNICKRQNTNVYTYINQNPNVFCAKLDE